jgi:hypothetical protein
MELFPSQRQQLKNFRLFRRGFDVAAPQCETNAFQFLDVGWHESGAPRSIVVMQFNLYVSDVFAFVNVFDCFLVSLGSYFFFLIRESSNQTSRSRRYAGLA